MDIDVEARVTSPSYPDQAAEFAGKARENGFDVITQPPVWLPIYPGCWLPILRYR